MVKVDIHEADLRRLYIDKRMNAKEIAKTYGCTEQTVYSKMRQYKISAALRPNVVEQNDKPQAAGTINCNEQGKGCIYKVKTGPLVKGTCGYFFQTGVLRMCSPEQCSKYVLKNKKNSKSIEVNKD